MRLNLTRDFYIPKNATIARQESDGLVYYYETAGVLYALAFHGKAAKPDWHFRFRNAADRDKRAAEYLDGRKAREAYKVKATEERKQAAAAPIKNGDYLSVAQVAALLRPQLAKHFPGVRFSVRSDSYSMGASIDVRWTDGPTQKQVDEIARAFSGSGFDGMIDLKYHYDHWLLPDGSVVVAHTGGTQGSMGVVSAYTCEKPHPDAVRVRLGADYVHTSRELSPAFIERCKAIWEAADGQAKCDLLNGPLLGHRREWDTEADTIRQLAYTTDARAA